MSRVADKPLRADARRNRQKVLAAARAVFSEQGVDAQMDDVARRADVGVGTVYRHFPTKEALLQALADELFERVAERGRAALEAGDAWEAFVDLMWFSGETISQDRAFNELMAASGGEMGRSCPGQSDLLVSGAELMRRAQAQGRMRPDAVIEDVPMLMCGLGSAAGMQHPCRDAWRRHLAILLDGLRAEAASGSLPC